jgi:four helix bundle protein
VVVDGDGDVNDFGQLLATDGRWRGMLSFQRLDVYRCAIELLSFTATIELPRGLFHLADQLRRAALSVPLNVAEAAGRNSDADAARHYAIARGSAMECAAIMDSLHVLKILDGARHKHAIELLSRIVAMLTKLCR